MSVRKISMTEELIGVGDAPSTISCVISEGGDLFVDIGEPGIGVAGIALSPWQLEILRTFLGDKAADGSA